MYPNLNAEMARHNIMRGELGEAIGWAWSTTSAKLNGKSEITLSEAKEIKKIVKTDLPIEELFKVKEAI